MSARSCVSIAANARAIFVWDGDFYAVHAIDRLGLAEAGGLVRVGINHYNTRGEVDRLLEAVHTIAAQPTGG